MNSENLIDHLSMHWGQLKDSLCYLWSCWLSVVILVQKVTDSNNLFFANNLSLHSVNFEFRENSNDQ